MKTKLKSLRIPDNVLDLAQVMAEKEKRKQAQILLRWIDIGMAVEITTLETGAEMLEEAALKRDAAKKIAMVARPAGSAEVGGDPQPSAMGVLGCAVYETAPDPSGFVAKPIAAPVKGKRRIAVIATAICLDDEKHIAHNMYPQPPPTPWKTK